MVKTTIMLSEEQHKYLKKLSYETGKSLGEIIREYVDQLMIKLPPKATFIDKFKERIPMSKETEEKLVNVEPLPDKTFVRKRGEMDPNDYI